MRRKPVSWLAVGAILAAAGCAAAPQHSTSADSRGGTLHLLMRTDFVHLDPARVYPSAAQQVALLFAPTLTSYVNEPGAAGTEVGPDSATDTGRHNADATTWSFTVRKNLRWQDGKPVTCEDFRYGVNRSFSDLLTDGPNYQKTLLVGGDKYPGIYRDPRGIPSVTCAGDTITYRLVRPTADFRYTVAMSLFSAVRKDKDTKTGYDTMPFSYGPYKFASHVRDQSMRLVRNPHWDQQHDTIRLNRPDVFEFRFGVDQPVITDRLIQDRGDDQRTIAFDRSGVTAEAVGQVRSDPKLRSRVLSGLGGSTNYLAINTKKVPDLTCRRAYFYAMDRKTYLTAVGGPALGDYATSISLPTSQSYRKIDPYGLAGKLEGDPVKARQLLAQSPNCPRKLTLDFASGTTSDRLGAAIIQAYARAGITIRANVIPARNFYPTIGHPALQNEIAYAGWAPDWSSGQATFPALADGRQIMPAGNTNYSQLNDPRINAAIDAANNIADSAKAQEKWAEVDRLVMDTAAIIPLRYSKVIFVTGSKVTGARIHSIYADVSLANIRVAG